MFCRGEFHVAERKYEFTLNGLWLEIFELRGSAPATRVLVFKRTPTERWLDADHAPIAEAAMKFQSAMERTVR